MRADKDFRCRTILARKRDIGVTYEVRFYFEAKRSADLSNEIVRGLFTWTVAVTCNTWAIGCAVAKFIEERGGKINVWLNAAFIRHRTSLISRSQFVEREARNDKAWTGLSVRQICEQTRCLRYI